MLLAEGSNSSQDGTRLMPGRLQHTRPDARAMGGGRILWGGEAPEQGRTAMAMLTAGRCTGAKSARVGPFGAHCRLRAAAAPDRGGAGLPTPAESNIR